MERIVHSEPQKTRFIRSPAAGPAPANTLAYLECRVAGVEARGAPGQSARCEVEFKTEFQISGFQQQDLDWHRSITLVSATGMFRWLSASTDIIFTFATDRIEPFIAPDGHIGFVCEQDMNIDDEAILGGLGPSDEVKMSVSVAAYVLCFEPRSDLPPIGRHRGWWADLEAYQASVGNRIARAEASSSGFFKRRPDARPARQGRRIGRDPNESC